MLTEARESIRVQIRVWDPSLVPWRASWQVWAPEADLTNPSPCFCPQPRHLFSKPQPEGVSRTPSRLASLSQLLSESRTEVLPVAHETLCHMAPADLFLLT